MSDVKKGEEKAKEIFNHYLGEGAHLQVNLDGKECSLDGDNKYR
jgi:hypothetical protein